MDVDRDRGVGGAGGVPDAALAIVDDDGAAVLLASDEAALLFEVGGDLDDATVSGCPSCRSRVLACLALVDLIDASAPHPRADEIIELADDAPSSHCYVHDLATDCRHRAWLDPGRLEWLEVIDRVEAPMRRPRH